jgi:hypothetical protein
LLLLVCLSLKDVLAGLKSTTAKNVFFIPNAHGRVVKEDGDSAWSVADGEGCQKRQRTNGGLPADVPEPPAATDRFAGT